MSHQFPSFEAILEGTDFFDQVWGRRAHLVTPNPSLVDCFAEMLYSRLH